MSESIFSEDKLLDRVRKLLAKAEDESCTPEEAQALTAKAAELMAKYGIDRALLGALKPESDVPDSRIIDIDNPWGRVKAHMLCALGAAMRCQCIMLTGESKTRIHIFGYRSDIERVDLMYTSLLLQMFNELRHTPEPVATRSIRAWRRSWLLGWVAAATNKVRTAENAAANGIKDVRTESGKTGALVLADRSLVVRSKVDAEYPVTRASRLTYTGGGYRDGYAKGQNANIGGTGLGRRTAGALK